MNLTTVQSKFEKLRNRRLPLEKQAQWFSEEYRRATKQTDYEYLVEAMQPIDNDYTDATFEQGDRVKNQLVSNLDRFFAAEYAYQGSVTSDTHIKVHSDIDLITVHGMFVSIETGTPNPAPYVGDVVKDLRSLRRACEDILTRKFPQVDVDTTGSKAIALSGGSLEREIDVVIANWWDTQEYARTSSKTHRGVHILDNDAGTRLKNMPFLHNARIHDKDVRTISGLRKAIRLLKTLKYDAEPVLGMSSYDVAAIAYAMPQGNLTVNPGQYLQLAMNVNEFLKSCVNSSTLRDSLYVPNGTRLIFGAQGATLANLKELQSELDGLLAGINAEKSVYLALANEMQNRTGFGQTVASWAETRSRRVAALL
jgi:hypothetical protein